MKIIKYKYIFKHGDNGYRLGCRCDICINGRNMYYKEYKKKHNITTHFPKTLIHGTYNRYRNGCRCIECINANKEYMQKWIKNRIKEKTYFHNNDGYRIYKCRCNKCKRAHKLYIEKQRKG